MVDKEIEQEMAKWMSSFVDQPAEASGARDHLPSPKLIQPEPKHELYFKTAASKDLTFVPIDDSHGRAQRYLKDLRRLVSGDEAGKDGL